MFHSEYTRQDYEQADFLRLLEHRIRKDIRLHNLVDMKQSYSLPEDGRAQTALLKYFLERIFEGRLQFSNDGVMLNSDLLDEFVAKRLSVFLDDSDFSAFSNDLFPLRTILQSEAKQAIEVLGLSGSFEEVNHLLIDGLQDKYAQTKSSLLKSFLHIENQLE